MIKRMFMALVPFLIFTFCNNAPDSLGQSQNVQPENWSGNKTDLSVVFLTSGTVFYQTEGEKPEYHGFWREGISYRRSLQYRVSFIAEEEEIGILVELISSGEQDAGEKSNIVKTYYYYGHDISDQLGMRFLGKMEFLKWKSWNTFLIDSHLGAFTCRMNMDGTLQAQTIMPDN